MKKLLMTLLFLLSIICVNNVYALSQSNYNLTFNDNYHFDLISGQYTQSSGWITTNRTPVVKNLTVPNVSAKVHHIQWWDKNNYYIGYYAYPLATVTNPTKNIPLEVYSDTIPIPANATKFALSVNYLNGQTPLPTPNDNVLYSDLFNNLTTTNKWSTHTYNLIYDYNFLSTIGSRNPWWNNNAVLGDTNDFENELNFTTGNANKTNVYYISGKIYQDEYATVEITANTSDIYYVIDGDDYVGKSIKLDTEEYSFYEVPTPIPNKSSIFQYTPTVANPLKYYWQYDYKTSLLDNRITVLGDNTQDTYSNNIYTVNTLKETFTGITPTYYDNKYWYDLGEDWQSAVNTPYNVNGTPLNVSGSYNNTLSKQIISKSYNLNSSTLIKSSSSSIISDEFVAVNSNNNYNFSFNSNNTIQSIGIREYDNLFNQIKDNPKYDNKRTYTFLTGVNTKYIKIYFYIAAGIEINYVSNIQINEGTTALPYQPYATGSMVVSDTELPTIDLHYKVAPQQQYLTDMTNQYLLEDEVIPQTFNTWQTYSKLTTILDEYFNFGWLQTGLLNSTSVHKPIMYDVGYMITNNWRNDNGKLLSELTDTQIKTQLQTWIDRDWYMVKQMQMVNGVSYNQLLDYYSTYQMLISWTIIPKETFTNNIPYYTYDATPPEEDKEIDEWLDSFLTKAGIFNGTNNTWVKIAISVILLAVITIILAILKAKFPVILMGDIAVFSLLALLGWLPIWLVLLISILMVLVIFLLIKGGSSNEE